MATPTHSNPMSTPLNNLPLNTQQPQQIDNSDLQDPLVQDVLKEFEQEVAAARNSRQYTQQMPPQQMPQQQMPPQQMPQQQMPPQQVPSYPNINYPTQYQTNKSYFDINIIKKSVIFSIIAVFIFYPGFMDILINKLPESIMLSFNKFDIYIRFILLALLYYGIIFFDYI